MTEPATAGPELRFGPFVLDRERAELRREGASVALPPQPFRVLVLLASRADHLVTREEIQAAIWGGATVVDFERGLNTCIRQIRTVLGDNAEDPQYVRTVPRQGYRFIAPVKLGGNGDGRELEPEAAKAREWHAGVTAVRVVLALLLFLFFLLVSQIMRGCHTGQTRAKDMPEEYSMKRNGEKCSDPSAAFRPSTKPAVSDVVVCSEERR